MRARAPNAKWCVVATPCLRAPAVLQVLNVDNATAAPSVLLQLERQRYLFNAGEGIQRHFIEHKMKLKKVPHAPLLPLPQMAPAPPPLPRTVPLTCPNASLCTRHPQVSCVLATRVSTDTLAGLPGMMLSQVEHGNELGRGAAPVQTTLCGERAAALPCVQRAVAGAWLLLLRCKHRRSRAHVCVCAG